MADISQIKLPDNNTYNFKDTLARGVKMYYGLCTSAADTSAKVVTVGADQDFKLTVGALLMVKFTKSNTASNVTLNVNSTGAKSIYYNKAVYTSTSTIVCGLANGHIVYMFGGTNWIWVGHGVDNNTTYDVMSVAEGQTATATTSRSMRSDYLKQIIQYHAVPSGQGVPAGGTAGQVLAKVDGTDYNTEWVDPAGGSDVQVIAPADFDSDDIPSGPFKWYITKALVGTISTSYSEYLPVLSTKASRSTTYVLPCYLYREATGDTIKLLYVGKDYYTLFVRDGSKWECITPIQCTVATLTWQSGSTPGITVLTTGSGYDFINDIENVVTNNSSKINNFKFEALVIFSGQNKTIKVPVMITPVEDFFVFFYKIDGSYYRVIVNRTGTNSWGISRTAL